MTLLRIVFIIFFIISLDFCCQILEHTWKSTLIIFFFRLILIFFARSAYRNVLNVSSYVRLDGEILEIITVRQFPPIESLSNRVNFEFLYARSIKKEVSDSYPLLNMKTKTSKIASIKKSQIWHQKVHFKVQINFFHILRSTNFGAETTMKQKSIIPFFPMKAWKKISLKSRVLKKNWW